MSTIHMPILNAAIEAELKPAKISCSWCKVVIREGDATKESHASCNACTNKMLDEIKASKKYQEAMAAVPAPTPAHQELVASVLQSRLAAKAPVERLAKPQEKAALYSTQTNRRGGNHQTVTTRKETPWSYNGIDIV